MKMQTKLLNFIFGQGRKNYYIAHVIYVLYRMSIPQKWGSDVDKNIGIFVSDDLRKDKRYLARLKRDIYFSMYYYMITPDEYFLFEFERLSWKGRNEFVGNTEKEALCYRKDNLKPPILGKRPHCYTRPCNNIFLTNGNAI